MQEALPQKQDVTLPNDVLLSIFNLLPFATRMRFNTINKFWHQTYQDPYFYLGSEHALLKMYDIKASPLLFRRLQRSLDSKVKLIADRKENTLWDSILYMLMAYINEIEDARLTSAQSKLQNQITAVNDALSGHQYQNLPYNLNLASVLNRILFLIEYAKSDERFKSANRQIFLDCCSTNKIGAIFINFNGGNLAKENLTDKCFAGSNFIKTYFCGAILRKTDFSEADCTEADFTGADIGDTNFCGANLLGANLQDCSGVPLFNRKTIMVGVQLSDSLKKIAQESNAVLTLRDLAIAMENESPHDAEALLVRAIIILVVQKINALNKEENKDALNTIKKSIWRKFLNKLKFPATLSNVELAVKELQTAKVRDTEGEEKTEEEILSTPRGLFQNIGYTIGLFPVSLVKSSDSLELFKDIKNGVDILSQKISAIRLS